MSEPGLDEALRLYGEARWYWQEWEDQRNLFDLLPQELWEAVIPVWEPVAASLVDEWFSRVRAYEQATGKPYVEGQQPEAAREREAVAARAHLIFPALRQSRAAMLRHQRAMLCEGRRTFWGLTLQEWGERDRRVWEWLAEVISGENEASSD